MRFFHTYPRDVGGTKVHATATTAALFQCPPHLLHLQRRYIGSPSARCARALHSCFGLVKWRVRSRALSFARERRRVFERCASLRVKNQRLLLLLPTYLEAPACLLIRRVRRFSASFRFFSFSASKYCVIVGMYTSSESSEISLNPVSFIAPIATNLYSEKSDHNPDC